MVHAKKFEPVSRFYYNNNNKKKEVPQPGSEPKIVNHHCIGNKRLKNYAPQAAL